MNIITKEKVKKIFYVLFPNSRQVEVGFVTTVRVFKFLKNKKKQSNMRFPAKLAIGSGCAMVFIIFVGFMMFPKMIKGKIKDMVNLKPGNDLRDMFVKVPFGLSFKVYVFTVLNPEEIENGGMPRVKEVGPFCYEEWKSKVNLEDDESEDSMSYDPVDTFYKADGPDCVDDNTELTIAHPMILGMVNAVARMKPGALTLTSKAIKSIWSNPTSIFVTVKAKDLLFDGIIINCGVSDFAGKAVCTNLKSEPSLKMVNENDVAFSLIGAKNATPGKRIKAYRGVKNYQAVGRIITFDGQPKQAVWNVSECDKISGTDGTIFPPLMTKEQGLASFAPDLCRSLVAKFVQKEKYNGIPVGLYSADLGDQSKNADEKCFCTTPETCMKKGMMDLFKCAKLPLYVSLPHFYDCHESYLRGVKGLRPDPEKHSIKILFETTTGSPVWARKRLQFNMPLEPYEKVDLFKNFTPTVLPMFWVEEGVDLNRTLTKPIKDLFTIKKVVKVANYLVLLISIAGLAGAGYLNFKDGQSVNITNIKDTKVSPRPVNILNTLHNGYNNGTENGAYEDKY